MAIFVDKMSTIHRIYPFLSFIVLILPAIDGFSIPSSSALMLGTYRHLTRRQTPVVPAAASSSLSLLHLSASPPTSSETPSDQSSLASSSYVYRSLFNFSHVDENAVMKFERIDDAIMGGISLSSIKQMPGEDFARWSGICRTDGGGFCGTRTLPFEQPLKVGSNSQGIYLRCRFTSDDEPQRRVWKLTTRTEASRGEQLYQATFEIQRSNEWQIVLVPFSSFAQVRGPRLIPDAPPLNTTGGLYQIGMTMSKFQMGANATEIPNFRPGFFELQLAEVGVYSSGTSSSTIKMPDDSGVDLGAATPVKTLSKEEVDKKRPVILKILSPVFKILFNEKRRRRASATRILKKKRNFSTLQLIQYGFRNRVARNGFVGGVVETLGLALQEVCTFVLGWTIRLSLFYPFVFGSRFIKLVMKSLTSNKKKDQSSEEGSAKSSPTE